MRIILVLIGVILTICSGPLYAAQEIDTGNSRIDINESIELRPGFGLLTGHYHALNPANKEEFDFPYYGATLALKTGENWQFGTRLFYSNYVAQFNEEGNASQHYFYGLGVEGRYSFFNFFYLKINCDLIQYYIKSHSYRFYELHYYGITKSGNGLVGSLGLGVNHLFFDHLYCYAGVFTSAGRVATEAGAGKIDEIFDFTSPANYEFGLTYYF
jgi:hypothetical protein